MLDRQERLQVGKQIENTLDAAYLKTLLPQFNAIREAQAAQVGRHNYLMGTNIFCYGMKVVSANAPDHPEANALEPDLIPAHNEWYAQFQQHHRDMGQVTQIIQSLMLRAKEWQDVRDMFPDFLLGPLLQFAPLIGHRRTRPDLYLGPPPTPETEIEYERTKYTKVMHWGEQPVTMFARISGTIALYTGYRLL